MSRARSLEKSVAAAKARYELLLAGTRPERLAQARAQLAELEAQLREMKILAPTNCVLEVLSVKIGDVLAPNREVAANYIAYVIDLKDGSSLSGMITEETAGSIKLKRIGAAEETILRQNIAKLTSSAISLMPEGLESTLPPQDMADLLAYLAAP